MMSSDIRGFYLTFPSRAKCAKVVSVVIASQTSSNGVFTLFDTSFEVLPTPQLTLSTCATTVFQSMDPSLMLPRFHEAFIGKGRTRSL
ncbi:hypothetical protein PanWU01x14_286630 [Parasponia andersonii]|uniref:Uncharacterized protein n=1 Tax=Parasponia andersonii TaxID=3476 RepID=A0A2P5AZ28_PARAD|nr:hypothetical protein PanWU01x14_286630 [Parasponia andersonii]